MATTISSGTNPYKLGSPPDFGTLYSGRALEFDGVTDYVDCGTNVDLGTDDFTITAWVYLNAIGADQNFFYKKEDASHRWYFNINYLGRLVFWSKDGGNTRINASGSTIFNAGIWYRIVVSADRDSFIKLYINGALEGTGSGDTNTIYNAGNLLIGKNGLGGNTYVDGKLTNAQIWNKAWSLSDVQYDYTHPEKLITDNSAVTSGTTISNLKAWYPMTEGNPRSPQTTVYDGSPKGLGSELVSNTNFDDETGWTDNNIGAGDVSLSTEQVHSGTNSLKITALSANDGTYMEVSIVTGNVYKISAWFYVVSGEAKINPADAQFVGSEEPPTSTTGSWEQVVSYFISDGTSTSTKIYFVSKGGAATFYLDDVSIKEVQMGNHGTTTFYGDELVTNGDMSGTTTMNSVGFSVSGLTQAAESGSIGGVSNTRKLTLGGADGNIGIVPNESSAVGRTYSISIKVYNPSSGGVTNIQPRYIKHDTNPVSYGSAITATDTWTTITGTMLYDGTVAQPLNIVGNGSNTEFFYIDDWSVKEVGVASGWTTADAEPLIPQTALMGMSKPILFDGIDDYVTVPGGFNGLGSSATAFTVSFWVNADRYTNDGFIHVGSTGGNGKFHLKYNGNVMYVRLTGAVPVEVGNTTVVKGAWKHIVIVYAGGSYCDAYVNASRGINATSSIPANVDFSGTNGNLYIGFYWSSSYVMKGLINEVSVWNTALTLAQVQELFNDGVAFDLENNTLTGSPTLAGYWRNDGWTDRSGNGNHGEVSGSPDTILLPEGTTSGKDLLGFPLTHPNSGWLNLDGSADYVALGSGDPMDNIFHGGGTVEAWIKPTGWGELNSGRIMSKSGSGNATGWNLYVSNSGLFGFISDWTTTDSTHETANGSIALNTWYHIVVTYNSQAADGTDPLLYIDSVNQTSLKIETPSEGTYVSDAASNLQIGNRGSNLDREFDGSIDEVRIYNRILIQAEITKNYKHGKSKHKN